MMMMIALSVALVIPYVSGGAPGTIKHMRHGNGMSAVIFSQGGVSNSPFAKVLSIAAILGPESYIFPDRAITIRNII